MYKKYVFLLLLIIPKVGFCLSCASTSLVDYLLLEENIVISFKVMDRQIGDNFTDNSVDIEVTHEFHSNEIDIGKITVDLNSIWGPSPHSFKINSEGLGVLRKREGAYFFLLCAPLLTFENGIITRDMGYTGIDVLDHPEKPVTIDLISMAIEAYQQGLSYTDTVCWNPGPHCSKEARYDIKTGILDLPSVAYSSTGISAYAKAKLQKTNDNPLTFTLIELNN